MQLKASDAPRVLKDGQAFSFSLSRSDLALWLFEPMPVILVVYDAQFEVAYWLYVQLYFDKLTDFNLFAAPQMLSVRIPKANILDLAAVRMFSRYRDNAVHHRPRGTRSDENSEEV